jgi:hypothetical protein
VISTRVLQAILVCENDVGGGSDDLWGLYIPKIELKCLY